MRCELRPGADWQLVAFEFAIFDNGPPIARALGQVPDDEKPVRLHLSACP